MEQTNRVAGDFANTSDGLANQQRIAAAEAENLKAEIGTELQPVVLELLSTFRELAPTVADTASEVAGMVAQLAPLVDVLGMTVGQLSGWISTADDASDSSDGLTRMMGDLFDAFNKTVNPVLAVSELIDEFTDSSKKATVELDKGTDATEDYRDAAERMRGSLVEVEGAVRIVEQETKGYTRTIRDLITAQAEAADPALALINANIRLEEAQNAVNEATEEFGSDSDEARDAQLALLSAVGDVDGALGNFRQNGGAESIEALRQMAERAGLSEDAIKRLIDEIKQLNNTPVKGITKNPDGTYRVGNINAFDTGGVVPGPRGSAQLAIVHGGETILPTHKGPVSVGMMGGGGMSSGTQQIVIQLDGQTLMTALAPQFQRYTNRTGRTVIS
jgi:hypothetical protein